MEPLEEQRAEIYFCWWRVASTIGKENSKDFIIHSPLAMAVFLAHFFLLLVLAGAGAAGLVQEKCAPARCAVSGPKIRFPFWLKMNQPDNCGYPGFDLSCTGSNSTEFELPFPVRAFTKNVNIALRIPVKVSVQEINYKSQVMQVAVLNASCLPKQLRPDMNSSSATSSPFEYIVNPYEYGFSLFNCSSNYTKKNSNYGTLISCLSGHNYDVYALGSFYSISDFPLASCVKMYDISQVPTEFFTGPQEYSYNQAYMHWSKPSCETCEAEGKYCRLKNGNTTDQETQCFDIHPHHSGHDAGSKKPLITGLAVGLSIILLTVVSLGAIICLKWKKKDQKNIENFLEDYNALRPTKFSYADIKKMTNQFKEKLGQGNYGTVYRGKLVNEIFVAVKVLNSSQANCKDFVGELVKRSGIQHPNVVRLVGYCADGNRRALVYEFLPNDSVEKFMSSGKQINQKHYGKLLEIAIGIAKGLDHLHKGCNQEVLHLDMKPHNILLDHNHNPKVTDFGLAKLCSKEQIILSMTSSQGGTEYIAPEVISSNFGNASSKSDVYSFGIMLLEMVGGTKRYHDGAQPSSQVYLPEWIYNQLDREEEIAIHIDRDESSKIKKKLIVVGLWCTQWHPSNRPSMKLVTQMLEGENMPTVPPNPFVTTESN